MADIDTGARPVSAGRGLVDELGEPVTAERVDALLAHFMFRSDPEAWEVGLVVKALALAALGATGEDGRS
jgi:hypothetical protein